MTQTAPMEIAVKFENEMSPCSLLKIEFEAGIFPDRTTTCAAFDAMIQCKLRDAVAYL
jgi:hypothetical protein